MLLHYKEYPIEAELIDGDVYVPFKKVFSLIFDFVTIGNVSKELRGVSDCNFVIKGKGRGRVTLINGNGLAEVLSRTIRLSHMEKLNVVRDLKKAGLNVTSHVSATRKELDFADSLREFVGYKGISLKRQVTIGDGYIYDLVIDDLIVEFDEDDHRAYSAQAEAERDECARRNGYRLVRVSDRDSVAVNLSKVSEELK